MRYKENKQKLRINFLTEYISLLYEIYKNFYELITRQIHKLNHLYIN